MRYRVLSAIFGCLLVPIFSFAQFTVTGEYWNRTEYQNGFNTFIGVFDEPTIYTGHRLRLDFLYEEEKLKIGGSIQDVRRWGQTKPIKETDGLLSVYEAWGQYDLTESFSLKVGRQELDFDNARFVGNLDWAFPGRAFDVGVFTFTKNNLQFMAGAGYYQPSDQNLTGLTFLKALHFAHFQWNNDRIKAVALFWNDGQQTFTNANRVILRDVTYRQTVGLPELSYTLESWKFNLFGYYQFGKDEIGDKVDAFDVSLEVSKTINTGDNSNLLVTLGSEYMSGNDEGVDDGINRAFNPLYGTNHKWNGYMDYFFVNGQHINSVGLWDNHIRLKQNFTPNVFLSTNFHRFLATADINGTDTVLGNEIDVTLGWVVSSAFSIQGGYSQFFYTNAFRDLRRSYFASATQNWGYVSLIFRPSSKAKFIGLKS